MEIGLESSKHTGKIIRLPGYWAEFCYSLFLVAFSSLGCLHREPFLCLEEKIS